MAFKTIRGASTWAIHELFNSVQTKLDERADNHFETADWQIAKWFEDGIVTESSWLNANPFDIDTITSTVKLNTALSSMRPMKIKIWFETYNSQSDELVVKTKFYFPEYNLITGSKTVMIGRTEKEHNTYRYFKEFSMLGPDRILTDEIIERDEWFQTNALQARERLLGTLNQGGFEPLTIDDGLPF